MKKLFLLPLMLIGLVGCVDDGPTTIEFDYIFTAQPVVFATSSKGYPVFKNVQEDFTIKTSGKRIIQASVFVKKDTDTNKASVFLKKLKQDIVDGINNPVLIKSGMEQAGSSVDEQQIKFGVGAAPAFNITKNGNGFSLGFEYTSDIKDEVSNFVSLMNPSISSISDEYVFQSSITDESVSTSSLKIVCPAGAPAVAFYKHATNDNFEAADPMSQFESERYDVIVAPTHGGMNQLINGHANYQIAATITFGNMYILSTGRDKDNEMNAGDKVLYFQKNDLPGKVFNYLYGDLGLKTYDVTNAMQTKSIIENDATMKI